VYIWQLSTAQLPAGSAALSARMTRLPRIVPALVPLVRVCGTRQPAPSARCRLAPCPSHGRPMLPPGTLSTCVLALQTTHSARSVLAITAPRSNTQGVGGWRQQLGAQRAASEAQPAPLDAWQTRLHATGALLGAMGRAAGQVAPNKPSLKGDAPNGPLRTRQPARRLQGHRRCWRATKHPQTTHPTHHARHHRLPLANCQPFPPRLTSFQ
jgi:hypothetical protein